MAATDKYKNGKRKDYASHLSKEMGGLPLCGNKNYGYSTNDIKDVDCLKCKSKYEKSQMG